MPPFRLFALSASKELAQAIAAALGASLSAHEERDFEDGEHKARPLDDVSGADVYVVQSCTAARAKASTTSCAGCCSSLAR